ncbi:DUF5602 domain-containing protein [Niabella sp. CC-SYL272]|uniref:DUF5602 domain-containing protein n=1 Tax=Niabella agricola TaxID=2891571 RepID=UPI001F2F0C99|nr:DUF5602 domain-containing protein [Niabella agricola]MCF3111520.1 DUF5602 domain-containing protein [Niabella agricola]
MKKFVMLSLGAALLSASCTRNGVQLREKRYQGPEVMFHEGKASTWYETDVDDKPLRLAIWMDDAAWNSLPTEADVQAGGGHHHTNNTVLAFHPKVDQRIFNHVGLDWNPQGHEPAPVYGLPHFDFHFYSMSPNEVAAIPAYEADSSGFKNWPEAAYFPVNYINPGGGVPKMGCHWMDVTSPELNGAVFGQTFLYGSYNGKVTFMEPMITKAFIEANPEFSRAIPQPAKVQLSGYYPTTMRLHRSGNAREVILEHFIYRTAQ